MARTIKTVTTATCDLCGKVKDEGQLRQLSGHPALKPGDSVTVDICRTCGDKPIHHALAFLDGKPPPT
jgi:hypothetical protein